MRSLEIRYLSLVRFWRLCKVRLVDLFSLTSGNVYAPWETDRVAVLGTVLNGLSHAVGETGNNDKVPRPTGRQTR